MNTAELIDKVREAHGIESDYRLAKVLKVAQQTVTQWRSGATFPGLLHVYELASMAGLEPQRVAAELELSRAEKAGRADQATSWRRWVDKLSSTAAAILAAVILSAGLAPGNARAGAGLGADRDSSQEIHRRGSRKRRRGSRASQAFAQMAETLAGQTREKTPC